MKNSVDIIKSSLGLSPQQLEEGLLIPISGRYGSCASLNIADDLDKLTIQYAQQLVEESDQQVIVAADIGASPYCPQALRLASVGLYVDAFDLEPPQPQVFNVAKQLNGNINYIQKNIDELTSSDISHQYALVYSQRCLFFLPFLKAKKVVELFFNNAKKGARFFLSFSNIDAPVGEGYRDRDKPVAERFCTINNAVAKKGQINMPICLYRAEDIENKLLADLPIKIIKIINKQNQAIKIIFQK